MCGGTAVGKYANRSCGVIVLLVTSWLGISPHAETMGLPRTEYEPGGSLRKPVFKLAREHFVLDCVTELRPFCWSSAHLARIIRSRVVIGSRAVGGHVELLEARVFKALAVGDDAVVKRGTGCAATVFAHLKSS